jgi:hypothetical protein
MVKYTQPFLFRIMFIIKIIFNKFTVELFPSKIGLIKFETSIKRTFFFLSLIQKSEILAPKVWMGAPLLMFLFIYFWIWILEKFRVNVTKMFDDDKKRPFGWHQRSIRSNDIYVLHGKNISCYLGKWISLIHQHHNYL